MVSRYFLSRTAAHTYLCPSISTKYGTVRSISTSALRGAVSNFAMPAMSPTMTSGSVAAWKLKEGQAFAAGDLLLEIETDKATMDVEAQEDGILAKIIVPDATKDVPVGRIIALLAEQGDDISNLELTIQKHSTPDPAPSSATATASTPPPATRVAQSHISFKRPLFPSVQRLIAENHIQDAENQIKGTGVRGMITKGDVLAFLGKAKSPTGSFNEPKRGIAVLGSTQSANKRTPPTPVSNSVQPLSGDQLRSLILAGLAQSSYAAYSKTRTTALTNIDTAQHLNVALQGYQFTTPTPAPELDPRAQLHVTPPVTRKDGIRSDDVLWHLI